MEQEKTEGRLRDEEEKLSEANACFYRFTLSGSIGPPGLDRVSPKIFCTRRAKPETLHLFMISSTMSDISLCQRTWWAISDGLEVDEKPLHVSCSYRETDPKVCACRGSDARLVHLPTTSITESMLTSLYRSIQNVHLRHWEMFKKVCNGLLDSLDQSQELSSTHNSTLQHPQRHSPP